MQIRVLKGSDIFSWTSQNQKKKKIIKKINTTLYIMDYVILFHNIKTIS